MRDIYDDEQMEMPCLCECGEWFDLNDGHSKAGSNVLVCESCHQLELKNTIPISDLKRGDKFTHHGDDYEVVRKFHPKHGYLIAEGLFGKEKFHDEDEEILKID
jgi:hypothetical protein